MVLVAAVIVLIPGAPLIQILFLTQALNAVLLPFMRSLGRDRALRPRPRRPDDRPPVAAWTCIAFARK
jgi:hypothetical protein